MRKLLLSIVMATLFLLPQTVQAQFISTYHLRMEVNDSTMGFTVPAPGDYTYYEDDTVHIYAEAYPGYILIGWERIAIIHFDTYTEIDTLSNDVACGDSAGWSFPVGPYYGDEIWVHKAIFIPDTATVTFGTNDPAMGTTVPAPGTYQYADGDTVYLTAVPNSGYQLSAWVQCGNETCDTMYWLADLTTLPIDINPTIICPAYGADNSSWTALFAPVSNTVTIQVVPEETEFGTVTGGGTYTIGDTVTITATPNHGYEFYSWTDWLNQTFNSFENPCTFIATTDMTLVAHFYPLYLDTFDITIGVNDPTMGTTNPAPGVHQYEEYSPLTVEAIPNTGYSFAKWTDEDGFVVSYANPYVSRAVHDETLIANFVAGTWVPDSMTITIAVNNPTMGTTNPVPGTYTYPESSEDSIVAIPNNGYYFYGWAVSASVMGMTISDTLFDPYGAVMYPVFSDMLDLSDVVLTAIFTDDSTIMAPDSMRLTIAVNDPTMGTTNPAPGTYAYADEEEYSITAIPNTGYQLLGWTMSYTYAGEVFTEPLDEAIMTITGFAYADPYMTNCTITAIFGPANISADSLTLIVGVDNPNGGSVTPAPGTYNYGVGETFTVTAAPNSGYHFAGWHVTVAHPIYGIIEDDVLDASITTITGEVDEDAIGYVHTVIALFVSNNGVEDAAPVSINAYGREGRIVLTGAEGREVYLFDINGRLLHHSSSAEASAVYDVPSSGVYLVNVAGIGTKRVVVIR